MAARVLAVAMMGVLVVAGTSCVGSLWGGSGQLLVGVAPKNVKIYVDDHYAGTTSASGLGPVVNLKPGTHQLTATYPGYEPWTGPIIIQQGERLKFDVPPLSEWQPAAPSMK